MPEHEVHRELDVLRRDLAAVRRRVERVPVRLAGGGGGVVTGSFWARLTGNSAAAHSWVEARPNGDGTLSDLSGGRSGTTSVGPAYEENSREGIPVGTHVLLRPLVVSETLIHLFTLGAGLAPGNEEAVGSSGETEAADTETWDITGQGSKAGVTLTTCTRVVYSDSGDKNLYAYYRDLTFDSNGMLTAVGAETRVTIDATEAC